jgi:NADH-quinone oxidoreductase subunit G
MKDPVSFVPPIGPTPAPRGVRTDRPAPAADPAAAPPALPEAGPDQVALIIDSQAVVVPKGTTVLQAAAQAGILVPHYCYHPGLSVAGNCRMCLVEIDKVPKLQIGCATTVAPGMVVRTRSQRVVETRKGIQEFLLINHPLDCPICDQAGECRLQQYEADYGKGYSRFTEEKTHHPKRYDIGRHVKFDGERCIKCTRCVRFCDEVSRTHELTLLERGDHAIIGTFPGRPLDNAYSGNTVDICPVGALTWSPFRFKSRVWFLKNTPSVCAGCARGCNVDVATYRNRIHRLTPRVNMEVNRYWMCDDGRRSHEALYERPRLDRPLLRAACGEGPQRPATRAEAVERAVAVLREAGADGGGAGGGAGSAGGGAIAAIVSARLTIEDLWMARRVLKETLGIERIVVPPHEAGQDDDLLIRRDKTPNARGAALAGLGAPDAARLPALSQDIAAGKVRGLVVVGEDPVGDGAIPADALRRLRALVAIDWWLSPTAAEAQVALPACGYGEQDGTVVNFEGRAQRLRAAVRPPGEAEPAWSLLQSIGQECGLAAAHDAAGSILADAARGVPALAGLAPQTPGTAGILSKGI